MLRSRSRACVIQSGRSGAKILRTQVCDDVQIHGQIEVDLGLMSYVVELTARRSTKGSSRHILHSQRSLDFGTSPT